MNICWMTPKVDGDGAWFNGRATKSIDEALRTVVFAQRDGKSDIYVGMSSQRTYTEKTSAKGHAYKQALRTQENVVQLRTLWLDVDVDADKAAKGMAYGTTAEAQQALLKFLADSGLPRPTLIVLSGSGGMHLHWCLDRALSKDEWQPLANKLAACTRHHKFLVDNVCTIDSARVLRIPGTTNYKRGGQRPVTLMSSVVPHDWTADSIAEILEPYEATVPSQLPTSNSQVAALPTRTSQGNLNADMTGGVHQEHRAVSLASIASKCAFIRDTLADGGASHPEPLWRASLHVALFTEEGRAAAHDLSKGHPGYDAAATDAKYDALQLRRTQANFGFPKCGTIQNIGCQACTSCPHFTPDFSPVRLGFASGSAQVVPLSEIPDGYVRGANGRIYGVELQSDGTERRIEICPYPIMDGWLQTNPYILNFSTVLEHKVKQIHLKTEQFASREGVGKLLFAQGMFLQELQVRMLKGFLVAWMNKLQASKDRVVDSAPFGWSVKGGQIVGFIYGGVNYRDDGTEGSAANPDPQMHTIYTPTGNLQPWLDAAKMITNQKRPALDAILAASFGAPLARFTGQSGMLMSAYSTETGIGKSTAMSVALAAWGSPQLAKQALNDTINSVFGKIGVLRHLPVFWDELKGDDDINKFVRIAFQLSEGKEKSRMASDGTLRSIGTWQTMLIAASNDSLLDSITQATKTTGAGIARFFEFVVDPGTQGQIGHSDAARMTTALQDNYGAAGKVYAQFLGTKHPGIATLVAQKQRELEKQVNVQPDERLWIATITAVIMGAKFANRLKLTEIDEVALEQFLITSLGKMRALRASTPSNMKAAADIVLVLQRYLTVMRARHTLMTNRIHIGRGAPAQGTVKTLCDVSRLEAVNVHHGVDTQMMRLRQPALREWLADNGYSSTLVLEGLEQQCGAKFIRVRLGAGTDVVDTFQDHVIEIDLTNPKLANLLN